MVTSETRLRPVQGARLGLRDRSKRRMDPALAVFCVLAAIAVPAYLTLGRKWWFYLDEWAFLSSRSAGSVGDLLRPYNQHWTTLPILVWRALWQGVGARSYVPYQVLSVLLHVVVAALGRAVMRRAGVASWVATTAAGSFLFFGAGAQNILSAFQIAFTGALAFGFAQLLLADHAGPLDRRDWFGLAAGLLGLMCSGVAVAMVVAVGIATLLRRGARVAAFHVVPLAAIYVAWYARYGRSATRFRGSVRGTVSFVRTGFAATFGAMGQVAGAGVVLGLVLAAGLVLLSRQRDPSSRADRFAMPSALLVGALVFFVAAAVGRTNGEAVVALPKESRYLYVAAALLFPVVAVAVDVVVRRHRAIGLLAALCLLVGIPGNVVAASNFAVAQARLVAGTRSVLLSIATTPLSSRAPGSLRPDPIGAPTVTLAWLRAQVIAGRVPVLHHPSAALVAADELRLSLMEIDSGSGRACTALTGPVTRDLQAGQRINIGDGAVRVSSLSARGPQGTVTFGNALFRSSQQDHALVAVLGSLSIGIAPLSGHRAGLC